jgi:hypothetical protein
MCSNERINLPENKWYPFCSERCKMSDLYNWISEEYFISEQLPQQIEENNDEDN